MMTALFRVRTLALPGALACAIAWAGPAPAQKVNAHVQVQDDRGDALPPAKPVKFYVFDKDSNDGNAPFRVQAPYRSLQSGSFIDGDPLSFMMRRNADDAGLGATFEPADGALREQLDLPAGQGLVVASSEPEGAASRVGLKTNDVLLMIADKPVSKPDDLPKQLRAAGDGPVTLKLLRAGKPMTLNVKPQYRVTFGPVPSAARRYVIGVQVQPVEQALRAQLGLADDTGVVIGGVESGSPADRAGLKKHDIIVKVGDQSLKGVDVLLSHVQDSAGKPVTVTVLHRGTTRTVEVTPDAQQGLNLPVEDTARRNSYLTIQPRPDAPLRWTVTSRDMAQPAPTASQGPQLGQILRELKGLRAEVEALRKALDQKSKDEAARPGH